jgi:D-glycero-alpha-D-manno-heptose-7-phosphate kinase
VIISRTPFRISFFGGGTDYPVWYRQHGGAVLATTIDKYCYLTCRHLPPFFEHKFRLVYSAVESCQSVDEIRHPSVRECLRYMNVRRGVEIHHDGDLPARSGMGSSSAFTVGLLHALHALHGRMPSKADLATMSIEIEQERLKEAVGSQDQVSAACGGFNKIVFPANGDFHVHPIILPSDRLAELGKHLMLFYTGIQRTASTIATDVMKAIPATSHERTLRALRSMVDEAIAILASGQDLLRFGQLLQEAWTAKRSLSSAVSNPSVEHMYDSACRAGAIGGKLTGAGGGGFMLLFVPPERQPKVREVLGRFIHVPFEFEASGSQIIFFDREQDYAAEELARDSQSLMKFRELDTTGQAPAPVDPADYVSTHPSVER